MASPKFFSHELAGAKDSKGIFAEKYSLQNRHPSFFNQELIDAPFTRNFGSYNGESIIPAYFAPRKAYQTQSEIRPVMSFMHLIAQNNDYSIYTSLLVHSLDLKYKGRYYNRYLADADIVYQVGLWKTKNVSKGTYQLATDDKLTPGTVILDWTENPIGWLRSTLKANNLNIPAFNWMNWQSQINLADLLTRQAEYFKNHFADLFSEYAENKAWCEKVLHNILHYSLPLKEYKLAYDSWLTGSHAKANENLLSNNEYMLLISDLTKLYRLRNKLPAVTTKTFTKGNYNPQQRSAIVSSAPLSLLQSVAGSGKSHTILGRIQYLLDQQIEPEKITALSFTNAAADHIKNKTNGKINSLTIAKMIHDIYQANLKQPLSTLSTVINSIRHAYGYNSQTAREFISYLEKIKNGEKQNQTEALYFIENNYQDIINILKKINQTTLELEEIICYINADNPKWIDPYKTKYLIVDEVQDTSIFQFIYLLHYAAVKKINVFFVGDASQTLYAFRDADPEALNLLESTSYFKTFKLETNYRSTPEILLYANQMLAQIKANRYAHLMLRPQPANNTPITQQTFTERIRYIDTGLANSRELTTDNYQILIENKLANWIKQNLANNEQTAFLSYTQKNAQKACDALHRLYPNAKTAVLSPSRVRTIDFLSQYIARCGSEMQYIPGENFLKTLDTILRSKISSLMPRNTDMLQMQSFLSGLLDQLKLYLSNTKSKIKTPVDREKAIRKIQDYMTQYEISYNYKNQQYFDNKTEENTQAIQNADFVISTIHSTKGLEFDNVAVLITNSDRLTQEQRRLYYVALTRAKKSEAVLEISPGQKTMKLFYENLLAQCQN